MLPKEVAIEHIGSTSVPGLLAKPIVDIMIGVPSIQDVAQLRAALTSADYEDLGEAGIPGRLYFRRRAGKSFNIALVEVDGSIWTANLALREYLRHNTEAAQAYTKVKRAAVDGGATRLLGYSDFKAEFVNRLVASALHSNSQVRCDSAGPSP